MTRRPRHRPRSPLVAACALLLLGSACTPRRRREPEPTLPPLLHPVDAAVSTSAASDELVPGTERAFGLLLPRGARARVGDATQRLFDIPASPASVIRYLQARLDIVTTDYLGPTGAMIRNAHVRASPAGESWIIDVGVRAEGDRSVLLLTNRPIVPATPRSLEDGLRAAGIDPRTHQPLPGNNN